MCIALIPLMGFTDNGLDYEEFYDSLWSQMWSLYKRKEDGGALTNTMILALHCANRTRLFKLFISVKRWFDSKQQDPLGSKLKGYATTFCKITLSFFELKESGTDARK